jgi:4-hydroxy-tetrahydrodipicolinate synthase
MTQQLHGNMTALSTPFDAHGKLDETALEKLVTFQLDEKVDALFVVSVCGECAVLDIDTRSRIVDIAGRIIGGRIPLIAGVMAESTHLAIHNIHTYASGNADYILSTPPNFLPLSQEGCREFFLNIAEESSSPVIIYNCPLNRNYLLPDTIVQLAEYPNIVGLKETSSMIQFLQMFLKVGNREDFTLFQGWEQLYVPSMSIGVNDFTVGGPGNMFPGFWRDIKIKYRNGQQEEAVEMFLRAMRFMEDIYALPCGALPAIKAVLKLRGLCMEHMSLPLPTAGAEDLRFIQNAMDKSKIF